MHRLWQQAYHIDYLAADIIRYFWRSRRRIRIDDAGESYPGEIPSSDIDASVYESHVSHTSHASSLHSTTRSMAAVPAETRSDFEFNFLQQITQDDAAHIISAAAGRMLWQQAYQVDYLASSIIAHFWRSRKRRQKCVHSRVKPSGHNESNDQDEVHGVQTSDRVMLVEDAVLILHACMARVVWRQGFVIDYIAASIIAHNWKKLKKNRAIKKPDVQFVPLTVVDPAFCAPSPSISPETAMKCVGNDSQAAAMDEAVEFSSQLAAEEVASSLSTTQASSSASKRAFGALLRASRTGVLHQILSALGEEKGFRTADLTPDARSLIQREALVVESLKCFVGDSEVIPHEIVSELLVQSGVFITSAGTTINEHLKAISHMSLRISLTSISLIPIWCLQHFAVNGHKS